MYHASSNLFKTQPKYMYFAMRKFNLTTLHKRSSRIEPNHLTIYECVLVVLVYQIARYNHHSGLHTLKYTDYEDDTLIS